VVESSTFNAELINKWVDLVPPALAYLFVATAMYDYAGMANIMYYYGTHYNNNTIIGGLSRSDYVLLLGHIDNESVIVANYTSNDSNYFKEKFFLGYWKYQILLCAISVILIVLCIYYIFVLKKSGKLKLNLISFILVEVTVTNVYQFIFNAIDPDYVYGIIESRVAIPLNNISWPITMFNILLIAINWEMLLQKITRSNVSQLKSRLIYIIIYSGILIIHLVLIFALPFVDANHYVPVMTSLQIVNIVPILASFIYCVINSIRIKPLKDMLQEKKKRKMKRAIFCIYIANAGLLIYLIGRIVHIYPFYWTWKLNYKELAYLFKSIGEAICNLGVIFSFNIIYKKTTFHISIKDSLSSCTAMKNEYRM